MGKPLRAIVRPSTTSLILFATAQPSDGGLLFFFLFFSDKENRDPEGDFKPNVLNTVCFLVSTSMTVATFLCNYQVCLSVGPVALCSLLICVCGLGLCSVVAGPTVYGEFA